MTKEEKAFLARCDKLNLNPLRWAEKLLNTSPEKILALLSANKIASEKLHFCCGVQVLQTYWIPSKEAAVIGLLGCFGHYPKTPKYISSTVSSAQNQSILKWLEEIGFVVTVPWGRNPGSLHNICQLTFTVPDNWFKDIEPIKEEPTEWDKTDAKDDDALLAQLAVNKPTPLNQAVAALQINKTGNLWAISRVQTDEYYEQANQARARLDAQENLIKYNQFIMGR